MPTPEIKIRPQPPHLHYLPISGSRLSLSRVAAKADVLQSALWTALSSDFNAAWSCCSH